MGESKNLLRLVNSNETKRYLFTSPSKEIYLLNKISKTWVNCHYLQQELFLRNCEAIFSKITSRINKLFFHHFLVCIKFLDWFSEWRNKFKLSNFQKRFTDFPKVEAENGGRKDCLRKRRKKRTNIQPSKFKISPRVLRKKVFNSQSNYNYQN